MIAFIKGIVVAKNRDNIVIETSGGVGYEVKMTLRQLSKFSVGQSVGIYTYLKVSDSALDLYGFETAREKEFFELLMTVSGVGPKSAMNILSLGNIDQIQSAIARGDITYLTAVQGLGKKTAERVVVELKNKVTVSSESGSVSSVEESTVLSEAIDGLVALGYSREEAKEKVKGIEVSGQTTQEILKLALQNK